MLTELIQGAIKKQFTNEQRQIIDRTQDNMQAAGLNYIGTCIPFKSEAEERSLQASAVAGVDAWDLEGAIYNTSALKQAGAKFIFSLKNNVQVPLCDKLKAYWAAETGAPEGDAEPQLSEASIAPHRLTTYVTISKMLLNQTQNVEALLTEMLATAINEKLESTIFSTAQEANGVKPFLSETASTITSYADICNLEDTTADILKPTYILSKEAKNKLRQMQRGTSNSNIMDGGKIDGTTTITSSNVEDSYLIYGDFSKFKVCVWSDGIDVLVDPITQAKDGNTRLIVNFYVDYYISNPNAFAIGKI